MSSLTKRFVLNLLAGRSAARVASPSSATTRHHMSTMHDNDPQVLDVEKRRNLSGTQHSTSTPLKNAPGWNEHLATTSEASVKADRSILGTSDELQDQTVEYIHARYSSDDRMEPIIAHYSRDEVSGPLGAAAGQEDAQIHHTVVKKIHEETEVVKDSASKGHP